MRFIVIPLHVEAHISLFADISLNCITQDVVLAIHKKIRQNYHLGGQ